MATKTATVNASDVAATLTDYPAYVDLSRVGITTLAEAESVRVYSDAGLTTELAREIVSASEMHVLIPSLTTSTQIWVDYDGSRADYAVSATYGRNAVWGDYEFVSHNGGIDDSTGNVTPTNNGASVITGEIGEAASFDGVSDTINIGTLGNFGSSIGTGVTAQFLQRVAETRTGRISSGFINSGATSFFTRLKYVAAGNTSIFVRNDSGVADYIEMTSPIYDNNWDWVTFQTVDTATQSYLFYVNGVSETTTQDTNLVNNYTNTTADYLLGAAKSGSSAILQAEVDFDEVRFYLGELPANWITTEYNNQNDEATFWGTWTDAGGGGATFTPKVSWFT